MDTRTLCMLTIAATLGFVSTPGFAKPADGEGRISSRRAKILERFDTNGNGVIDPSEREAIGKARMERRGERRERCKYFMKKFDANGDGQLDEQERAAARESRRARILKHFDADGNGVLDDDERKTARKARRHRTMKGHETLRRYQRLQLQGVEGQLLPR